MLFDFYDPRSGQGSVLIHFAIMNRPLDGKIVCRTDEVQLVMGVFAFTDDHELLAIGTNVTIDV